ncbi:PREDICTED: probable pectinesterase 55 isoform X2 [Ipomoea nil]|uniref:probable pectinesterase 55 isoform X2 n=1 Tax=Ipomoea nil TaxID=35883 RepID=UPI000901B177|nr:PREDICTED: probable pectinesterase 55 isoform X2 [Ipomoea nil]
MVKNVFFFFLVLGWVSGGRAQYLTIHVDQSGSSDFKTIQSAIDSVPSNNSQWVCISIKPAIYLEQVTIPYHKQYIYLKGEGNEKASIVWESRGSFRSSPTFSCFADNIKVENLNFVNSYNYHHKAPAVAANVVGDRMAFYDCGFYGVQDTLLDARGKHYFKRCIIEGAVDFIFGAGQSIFEECTIVVNVGKSRREGSKGYITAQGRSGANDSNAFVFKNCNVTGSGKAILGRPWRPYARVIFFNSSLSDVIVPYGWDSWNYANQVDQLTFAEINCYGPGSNTSKRVAWEAQLSQEMTEYFVNITKFIDADQWGHHGR